MKSIGWRKLCLGVVVLGVLGVLAPPAALADFELVDGQGRRILLKDDGTWQYRDAQPPAAAASAGAENRPQAELVLERRVEAAGSCRFDLALRNTLPYEIRSLVPEFTVFRANGVAYTAQSAAFGPVRPGDLSRRSLQFIGIGCTEITRLLVQRGDRCEMGDLNKFSDAKGECLARVRVLPSELLSFEKG